MTDSDKQSLIWPFPLIIGCGIACIGVPWLHLQAVAASYQAVGVALTALGIAAVGDRLRWARRAAVTTLARARSGVAARISAADSTLRATWARVTRKSVSAAVQAISAQAGASASASVTVEAHRPRVDRDTISDRDWLAYLDDHVAALFNRLDESDKRRHSEREEFTRRLGVQRDELRTEIVRETRHGWQLVAWGLAYTFIGAVLSAFA